MFLRARGIHLMARMLTAFLFVLPLSSQVDKRLATFKTDFLDLLQRAVDIKAKPEILTLFDFSGSMGYLSFHKDFPNWEEHESASSSTGNLTLRVTANADDTVSVALGPTGGSSRTSYTMASYYPYGGFPSTLTLSVVGIGLVNPAGQMVTSDMVDQTLTATDWTRYPGMPTPGFSWVDLNLGRRSAANWVRAASHARFRLTVSGNASRDIDIPLAWAVVKQDPTNTTAPLERVKIADPTDSAAPQYEVDTTFLDAPGVIGSTNVATMTWSVGTNTRPNTATMGNYWTYLRLDYLYWICAGKDAYGNFVIPDVSHQENGYPFKNGLPTVTRLQALKEATIRTWLNYQDRVYWAFRTLDESESTTPSPTGNTDSSITIPSNNSSGPSRSWVSFNKGMRSKTGGSNQYDNGVLRLSKLVANGSTYLNRAVMNSYVQMIDTTNTASHVFAKDGTESAYECSGSFLMVFTDGVPSDEPGTTTYPYAGSSDPIVGNKLVIADADPNLASRSRTYTGPGKNWYNLPTLAAMAAQSGNPVYTNVGTNYILSPDILNKLGASVRKGYPNTAAEMYKWLPFTVVQRGTTKFAQPRPIQTMTVGMSLGSAYTASPFAGGVKRSLTDIAGAQSPKYRLVAAAHFGDPDRTKFDMSRAGTYDESKLLADMTPPYTLPGGKKAPPTCFFDAADPDALVTNMAAAFDEAIARSQKGTSAAPVVPYSGLGLGAQVYLASFNPSFQGPLWSGDLRMFPTITETGSIKILDRTGTEVVGDLLKAVPMWSAATYLDSFPWSQRKVYTRLSGESTLRLFNPGAGSNEFSTIAPYFATHNLDDSLVSPAYTLDQKKNIARFLIGADTSDPANNRTGVMGDVIDSSITVLEYLPSSLNTSGLDSTLVTSLAIPNARFRVIFVGTNTGFIHAFAEVSYPVTRTAGSKTFRIVEGVMQELWSFIPTDFLSKIQFLQKADEQHRNLCNGPAYAYHLDLPSGTNRVPDGQVNSSADPDNKERAVLVFGLGKGGRSFYGLNVRDPFNPTLAWSLVPDEVEQATTDILATRHDPKGINLVDLNKLVKNMGFATARPAVGRVLFPHPTVSGVHQYRDVCFLSGGLASSTMETAFKGGSATVPAMGRSIIALDVYTGNFMAAYDVLALASSTSDKNVIDCIPTGVVPFEFFVGSGLVQRLYFTDYRRGLWSIQSSKVNDKDATGTADHPYKGFRRDSSLMDEWAKSDGTPFLRKVLTAPDKEYFSMLPAPFVVGTYPVARTTDPKVAPAVAGIAISSGDKYNPADRFFTSTTLPSHRLYMVFDRQDGPKESISDTTGITMSQMFQVTASTPASSVSPFSSSYFLKPTSTGGAPPYFGYTIDFPVAYAPDAPITDVYRFVPKALNDPMVLVGTLFYSYFSPDKGYDPCYGGQGATKSFRICDFLSPQFTSDSASLVNAMTTSTCETGMVFSWNGGLSTQFVARGIQGINQAGLIMTGNDSSTTVQIKTATTRPSQQWPRVRTWRSVYDY